MKLLLFPLIFLVGFTFLSQMGLGASTWDVNGDFSYGGSVYTGWYDSNGWLVCYKNYTKANAADDGHMAYVGGVPYWQNSTGSYLVYDNPVQSTTENVGFQVEFDIATSLGLVAIVSAGILFAGFLGTRILGSSIGGGNDESASAIWKGTVLLVIWGAFSAMAIGFIAAVPLFGPFFYMFLTIVYCLGVVNQVGHPGED